MAAPKASYARSGRGLTTDGARASTTADPTSRPCTLLESPRLPAEGSGYEQALGSWRCCWSCAKGVAKHSVTLPFGLTAAPSSTPRIHSAHASYCDGVPSSTIG